MRLENEIETYFESLKKTIDSLDKSEIDNFIKILLDAYKNSKNIYIFGNGGSATTASHFACDINKGVSLGLNKRFKIIPFTDNMATVTACGNDLSYEDIFVEQLKNFLNQGDIVIGISGSGNSKNVLKAIDFANQHGNITIGITGYDGGQLRKMTKYSINANVNDMQISEDIHMILTHVTMKLLNNILHVEGCVGG
jgi:D-sedoheptulose 7-phosphate isomerase